ncbi:hypothetical protein [Carboxylicivirga sp. N1Y90]|uniref:hypothetical protein n=1 Tax=Carboxylicivirga fragile TaxID=3417571 RepID=UPI003D341BFF|nr:hypothetical protein [Marinilabiliaceae bacterium N1Y90]
MNYIRHLNSVLDRLAKDQRVLPRHISLYMALFHIWNKLTFIEGMQIARQEVMPLSKIGSINTYTRTIKELDAWGYVKYKPSKSMYQGSKVTIITFDNTGDNSTDNSDGNTGGFITDKTTDKTSAISDGNTPDHSGDKTSDTPLINNYKTLLNKENNNKLLQTNGARAQEEAKDKAGQKPLEKKTVGFKKPELIDVKSYFQEKEINEMEAVRFFNYFESNGWKVGGKSPMKDWSAAARNWILNISRYADKSKENGIDYLSTKNDKDYDEPL